MPFDSPALADASATLKAAPLVHRGPGVEAPATKPASLIGWALAVLIVGASGLFIGAFAGLIASLAFGLIGLC